MHAVSQWETTSHNNVVSHWLGTYTNYPWIFWRWLAAQWCDRAIAWPHCTMLREQSSTMTILYRWKGPTYRQERPCIWKHTACKTDIQKESLHTLRPNKIVASETTVHDIVRKRGISCKRGVYRIMVISFCYFLSWGDMGTYLRKLAAG